MGWHVVGIAAAFQPQANAAFAQPQRHPVTGREIRVVAGGAGDVAVAREDGIVEQQLAQNRLVHIYGRIGRPGYGAWQRVGL